MPISYAYAYAYAYVYFKIVFDFHFITICCKVDEYFIVGYKNP